ncbi:glycosyltransferase family 2 protein [Nocardioides speluncae]|uniref:glycosyltransferase family 2 protein n=1 Tax=Nocardioides speluncae TaxID=2670337 RepID=UPI001F0C710A|nr:glycosyltransferase family 2 protein [Nocardioides speluncae]
MFGRRQPLLSVVVPVYNVEDYLPACLDSVLASRHRALDVVVVDDGATDSSGAIADGYAERDDRVRVVHTANGGLGAARNVGMQHVRGEYVAFLDSDDVVPPAAYSRMVGSLTRSGSDFATGSIVRWETDRGGELHEPGWMHGLHNPRWRGITADQHPEILGDVFAWNKVFRTSFWQSAGLEWPERVRYEDQPTTTRAYLAGRFDVLPDIVYHWRIRGDGTSITQQRSALADLEDRIATKRMALASVEAHGNVNTREVFLERVLAGDMHRYFIEIPGCSDEWWTLLQSAVVEFWSSRSLVHSVLTPLHRLTGWLVEHDRRADATAVMEYAGQLAASEAAPGLGGVPVPSTGEPPRLDLAKISEALKEANIDPAALTLRPDEA